LLWCGASWDKSLWFWLTWGIDGGWEGGDQLLGRVWYFSPDNQYPST